MEEDSASAPAETHPLLPLQTESGSGNGGSETSAQHPGPSSNPNPASDDDVTDDSCRRSTPPCADDEGVISSEPKSGGEYTAIIEMLKDAEKAANDPDYEEKVHARKFGAIKYNPRNQESSFGPVDYCCAFFQCCAVCIEG
ncbi:unnamed protein product [Orchesella dallaii]|uniref:Uncharacterized protein n=1 Tax=Orchesella dallaii TaxID=48710 RepID=A0ABP1QTI7_9HEXA